MEAPFDGRVEAEGPPVDGRVEAEGPPCGRTLIRSASVAVAIIAIGIIMLYPVRSVSRVIVMINLISVIYYYCITSSVIVSAIIPPMMIPVIMTINANG